jgi:hypothetical protein
MLAPEIQSQIDGLDLVKNQPLIVCDADEVLFKFFEGLEAYLGTQGYWVDLQSFRITGNVKSKETNEVTEALKVKDLLSGFFAEMTPHLDPVEGAADALAALASTNQIVILSNLPIERREARIEALHKNEMPYQVIANQGEKGPACEYLANIVEAPIAFLDDLPPNITSVRKSVPSATLIHFIADPRLAKLLGAAEDCDYRIDTWPEAHETLSQTFAR